jgi:hypothetical protein
VVDGAVKPDVAVAHGDREKNETTWVMWRISDPEFLGRGCRLGW